MSNSLQRNPATAIPWLLGGAAVAAAFVYWTGRGTAEAAEVQVEEEATPMPTPSFDPVNTEALTISEDCMEVVIGQDWSDKVAFPSVQQQVQQLGRGLSLYPQNLTARSGDAVVRQVLSSYSPCIETVLWRDQYMENNPFPTIEDVYTAPVARQAINAWVEAWSIAWMAWSGQHLQLAALIAALRSMTEKTYVANLGVDLQHQPVDTGTYPPGLTAGDKAKLMELGYDLNAQVVQDFQNHYNLVKNFETQGQWGGVASLDLIEDNTINDETRDALIDAKFMLRYGAWMGLVETAANA